MSNRAAARERLVTARRNLAGFQPLVDALVDYVLAEEEPASPSGSVGGRLVEAALALLAKTAGDPYLSPEWERLDDAVRAARR